MCVYIYVYILLGVFLLDVYLILLDVYHMYISVSTSSRYIKTNTDIPLLVWEAS